MTIEGFRPRTRPRRRRRRRRPWIAWVLLLAVVFALGIALGQALHDNPKPGGTQTRIRTLKPVPLRVQRETVTLTVQSP